MEENRWGEERIKEEEGRWKGESPLLQNHIRENEQQINIKSISLEYILVMQNNCLYIFDIAHNFSKVNNFRIISGVFLNLSYI